MQTFDFPFTNGLVDSFTVLAFLREIRRLSEQQPSGFTSELKRLMLEIDHSVMSYVSSDIVVYLRDKGLIQWSSDHTGVQTTSAADRMLDAITDLVGEVFAEFKECNLTFSHTRQSCGNPYCREF